MEPQDGAEAAGGPAAASAPGPPPVKAEVKAEAMDEAEDAASPGPQLAAASLLSTMVNFTPLSGARSDRGLPRTSTIHGPKL